jgi:hypothetical protein
VKSGGRVEDTKTIAPTELLQDEKSLFVQNQLIDHRVNTATHRDFFWPFHAMLLSLDHFIFPGRNFPETPQSGTVIRRGVPAFREMTQLPVEKSVQAVDKFRRVDLARTTGAPTRDRAYSIFGRAKKIRE